MKHFRDAIALSAVPLACLVVGNKEGGGVSSLGFRYEQL
jgi:hypothetical protein